jgi:hypothetical protein
MGEFSDILDIEQIVLWFGLMIAALLLVISVINRFGPQARHPAFRRQECEQGTPSVVSASPQLLLPFISAKAATSRISTALSNAASFQHASSEEKAGLTATSAH